MSDASKGINSPIHRLVKVVSEYNVGVARIEREFDEACNIIDKTLVEAQRGSARQSGGSVIQLDQERALRAESEHIKKQISQLEDRVSKIGKGISTVNKEMLGMKHEKRTLEKQIEARVFIENIFYALFQDAKSERRNELQRDLDTREKKKKALQKTQEQFEYEKLEASKEKARLTTELARTRQKLEALHKSIDNMNEQARMLGVKRKEAEERRAARKKSLLTLLASAWERASAETAHDLTRMRQLQPSFVNIGEHAAALEMPDCLLFGSQKVTFKSNDCIIPHVIPFPLTRALVLPEDNDAQRRLAHHLILRLLQATPPGQLKFTLIDPLELGKSFDPFLPLLKQETVMPQRRVLTCADEIERALGQLVNDAEEVIQYRFKGRISTWSEYNKSHSDTRLGYTLVLLFGVPEQLSDKSLYYLQRLIENGPRCGILPVVAVTDQRLEERRYEKLNASLRSDTQRIDALLSFAGACEEGLSLCYEPEEWPSQVTLDAFLSDLARRCEKASRLSKEMRDLWIGEADGAASIDGIEIPVGWTPSGETVSLLLGLTRSEHHALLAGKTGTGKSNLLHVIIHSLCDNYAPEEIDLYLLDYKEATEFSVYAHPPLAHARLVAMESDPEYGITVLEHLVREIEDRGRKFKSARVSNIVEYRGESRERLPRVLLIIDEFQVLFSEGGALASTAERLLSQLLKQGRAFGIHILLATQTLKGLNAVSMGSLISQLGCRIALACSQEDSALILGGRNEAAAELKSPPEGIINDQNGARSANIKFLIPLAEKRVCREHLTRLSERTRSKPRVNKTRVFNGATLPHHPRLDTYKKVLGQEDRILLGEELTFNASPLCVPLTRRQTFNLLFCGCNDQIHDGLLISTIASIQCQQSFDEIAYFNGRGVEPLGGFSEIASLCGDRFSEYNEVGALPLQEIADNIGTRQVALIIDGLEAESSLHPSPSFSTRKPGDPSAPADLLKHILENGSRRGTFVFAFIDNWRRFSASCRDLVSLFEYRVAFCMNEEDAGALVSGPAVRIRELEKPNRAVFIKRSNKGMHWFRPYCSGTGEII